MSFLDQKLQFTCPQASTKDVQATGEAFRPQKRTSSTSKHEICSLFLFLWVIFALLVPDPDPLTLLNPDPVRIRFGIRSTDHASTHMLCVDKNILFPKFNTFLDFSFFVFSIYSMHRMRAHITFSVQASDLTHRSVSMSDVLGEPFRTPQNVKPFNRYSILFLTSLSSTVSSQYQVASVFRIHCFSSGSGS